MSARILILQLVLIISLGSSESSGDNARPGPTMSLECLNDFITELTCRLTSDQHLSCLEYRLNVFFPLNYYNLSTCKPLQSRVCECLVDVKDGFVLAEPYTVDVLSGKSLLHNETFYTRETVKPRKPVIESIRQTQGGDFAINWTTIYMTEESVFNGDLIPELSYYIEGNNESIQSMNLSTGQRERKLIGRNLQPNTCYVVKLRVILENQSRFSDYSEPYRFTTPSSLTNLLKIIIPVVCIILIMFIFIVYYFYNKVQMECWEKIPTPKIATSFVKQVPNLLSLHNEFSPVHLDSSKALHYGEKTWPVTSLADVRGENSLNSLGKDTNSAEVIYGQTGNESLDDNSTENEGHLKFLRECRSTNLGQIPMSNKYYKNLGPNSDGGHVIGECGNSSGFSNKFYMFSASDKNPASQHFITDSESMFPVHAKNLDPLILTDFCYGPCTGGSSSESSTPTQFTPSSNEIVVVPGYQSVTEVIDCPSTDQAFISSHNNANLIMEKFISSKNPQNISFETAIIPMDNGYKDVQSLLLNSGEPPSFTTEPELKQLCGQTLHTSPGIQIDCSYHRV